MAHIHRKYIDSHWGIFIAKGLLTLFFGWLCLFNSGSGSSTLISLVSVFLLCLSIVEFGNSLYRAREAVGWSVSVAIAVFDAIVAITLLLNLTANMAVALIVLAVYTVIRGVCEIVIGFRTTVDPTDRFMWLFSGICACIMGIVIMNSGHLAGTDYIRFFGAYLLIASTCNLIYGVHNRAQQAEDSAARSEAAKSARVLHSFKTAKKKMVKKSSQKQSVPKQSAQKQVALQKPAKNLAKNQKQNAPSAKKL